MHNRLHNTLLLIASIASLYIILTSWGAALKLHNAHALSYLNEDPSNSLALRLHKRNMKPEKQIVKGIYLTAYSSGSAKKVDSIINLINSTELNSIVIDIKDYSGKILYNSDVVLVNELETEEDRLGDVRALIDKLHKEDIYVIARQTVFQDPILAEKKSEWAIKSKSGGVWRDHKWLSWVDPTQRAVWEYNVDIAKEAISLGFDEINFDYVRFPSDGNMDNVVYTNGDNKKYEVMHDFFHYLSQQLRDEPAWISIDMFGLVMERGGEDDLRIGQRLADAVDYIDYICPMMYPSHYPEGHIGLVNPAELPGKVINNGMKLGSPAFADKRAQLRPWLQAFNIGAIYDASKIRAQINMVEAYPNAGWFLWNASNRYSKAGLREK